MSFDTSFEDFNTISNKNRRAGAKLYFCDSCQGILTPKPTKVKLSYYCPNCKTEYEKDDYRVYVNLLKKKDMLTNNTHNSISNDPTLKRDRKHCETCKCEQEVVLFMAPALSGEESLKQMMECTVCSTQSLVGT